MTTARNPSTVLHDGGPPGSFRTHPQGEEFAEQRRPSRATLALEVIGLEDEQLPDYDSLSALPTYAESALEHPTAIFRLRQLNRKHQTLEPILMSDPSAEPSARSDSIASAISARSTTSHNSACSVPSSQNRGGSQSYLITRRTTPRVFTRKPDIGLSMASLAPAGLAGSSSSTNSENLASATFDDGTDIPWIPRATLRVHSKVGKDDTQLAVPLESRNFLDWTFSIQSTRVCFAWRLISRPAALVLFCKQTPFDQDDEMQTSIVARFTFSPAGSLAAQGAEVGELALYENESESRGLKFPSLVVTLAIAMAHLRRMGRHYFNYMEEYRRFSVGMSTGTRGSLTSAPTTAISAEGEMTSAGGSAQHQQSLRPVPMVV